MKTKYETLLAVLDQLRDEAPQEYKRYHAVETDQDGLDKARAKAFLHLFLKVRFGLLEFRQREACITDDPDDGGIDAYYIDEDKKQIYLIQSKFRTTEKNFGEKAIDLEDILKMDVARISHGETTDGQGRGYNAKVRALIKKMQMIPDVARWDWQVVLLANVRRGVPESKLRALMDGCHVKVYDYARCYKELVFPLVSGTYYNVTDLSIEIALAGKDPYKNSILYNVRLGSLECEITVLFVPTIEIANAMHKYKNSILRYNPRSYLGLSTNDVNQDIAATIETSRGNEFVLFNNGITIVCDEAHFADRVGRPRIGQLIIKNPQIINGGQTAYTLSHLYENPPKGKEAKELFEGKEVLLKVIAFAGDGDAHEGEELALIERISRATNRQSLVDEADRRSNEGIQVALQENLYADFGYFYERKEGEFYDGLQSGYIDEDLVIDRNRFLRACYAIAGKPDLARGKGERFLFSGKDFELVLGDGSNYRTMFLAYLCDRKLEALEKQYRRRANNKYGIVNYGYALRYGKYAVISAWQRDHTIQHRGPS